jgi:hypothetical protein
MKRIVLMFGLVIAVTLAPSNLYAYVGPGAGLSAFGALVSLVGGVFLGILGFIWYPIKRLIRAVKRRREPQPESLPADSMVQ